MAFKDGEEVKKSENYVNQVIEYLDSMKYMYSNTKIYKKHWLNKREYWREKKYSKNFSVTFFICRYPHETLSLSHNRVFTLYGPKEVASCYYFWIFPLNQTKKNLKELLSEYNLLYKCYCFVLGFQTVFNCLI